MDYKDNYGLGKLEKPSDGFFFAKRQMQEFLDAKVVQLRSSVTRLRKEDKFLDAAIASLEADLVEKFRDYVRNGMLWDTEKGK